MNVGRKNIVVLVGLLLTASLQAMTPEEKRLEGDMQARLDRLRQLEVEGKLAKRQAAQDAGKVLVKRDLETRWNDDEPESKKAKHEQKNEMPDVPDEVISKRACIQPEDVDQPCEIATVPPEVLVQAIGSLDIESCRNLSRTCRFFSDLLNDLPKDPKAIEKILKSELRSRGNKNIAGRLCSYFPECMKTSDVEVTVINGYCITSKSYYDPIKLGGGIYACISPTSRMIITIYSTGQNFKKELRGHTRDITSLLALNNGTLASSSFDNTIIIWNPDTGECLHTLQGHTAGVTSVIVLKNGTLASSSYDNTIKIWNPDTGECLHTLQGHTLCVNSVIELRGGALASCSRDGTIKIWDPANGECLQTLQGHTGSVVSVIELHDGTLASCSGDGTIKIWHLAIGGCLGTFMDDFGAIRSVIQLENGIIVTGSQNGIITLWFFGEYPCKLRGHTEGVNSIIKLQNGNIASYSGDGTIKIWNIYPEDLSAQQIYLVLRLSKYADHNEKIKLDAFWSEIYNSLPDYLKNRFENIIEKTVVE